MNEYDLIKKQIKTIKDLYDNTNPIVSEQTKNIKKKKSIFCYTNVQKYQANAWLFF